MRKSAGFTLVELIVVVAMFGIVAAIIIPIVRMRDRVSSVDSTTAVEQSFAVKYMTQQLDLQQVEDGWVVASVPQATNVSDILPIFIRYGEEDKDQVIYTGFVNLESWARRHGEGIKPGDHVKVVSQYFQEKSTDLNEIGKVQDQILLVY